MDKDSKQQERVACKTGSGDLFMFLDCEFDFVVLRSI